MEHDHSISLLIADTQYLTSYAIENILSKNFKIAGKVFSLNEVYESANTLKDKLLLIIDPFQLEVNDLDKLIDLKKSNPAIFILLLVNSITKEEIELLNRHGINDILLKTAGMEELFQAVEATVKGKRYYSQEIFELILEHTGKKEKEFEVSGLTVTEIDIVKLIAQGFTTKEIASKKFISFHTVMTHRKNIFRKLKVSSISELIMYSIKAGWIDNIEYYI